MLPVLLEFKNITIFSFDAAVIISFLTIYLFSIFNAKKKNIDIDQIINIGLIIIFSMIIGARLLYVLTHFEIFNNNFIGIFNPVKYKGSMGLGGFVLTSISIFTYCYLKKISFLKITDLIMPYFILGVAIFRTGCFLNGCCFGKPTNLPWGLVFSLKSPAGVMFPLTKIHPTQLYLIILYLIAFFIILYIEKKITIDGIITSITLMLYGFSRFLVDFFRYYEKNQLINLLIIKIPINQIISFLIILTGIIIFIILKKKIKLNSMEDI